MFWLQLKQRDETEAQHALENVVELVGATPSAMAQSVERLINQLNRLADSAQTEEAPIAATGPGAGTATATATTTSDSSSSLKREMFLRRLQIALSDIADPTTRPAKQIGDPIDPSAPAATATSADVVATANTPAAAAVRDAELRAKNVAIEIKSLPANQQVTTHYSLVSCDVM